MLIQIPNVLTQEEVAQARKELDATSWVDGKVTAGFQSAQVKQNMQLPESNPVGIELGRKPLCQPRSSRRSSTVTTAATPSTTTSITPCAASPPPASRFAPTSP
jgi:predicted 2-oxoglutarate/Fe(II)-dependent dioxygenase YbiX